MNTNKHILKIYRPISYFLLFYFIFVDILQKLWNQNSRQFMYFKIKNNNLKLSWYVNKIIWPTIHGV